MDYSKKTYTEEELIELAKRRIKIKRELYEHIIAYVLVNGFLVFLYWLNNPNFSGHKWFFWVLGGWGLGLLFHISETIQDLSFKYNTTALNKELEKIKKHIDVDNK